MLQWRYTVCVVLWFESTLKSLLTIQHESMYLKSLVWFSSGVEQIGACALSVWRSGVASVRKWHKNDVISVNKHSVANNCAWRHDRCWNLASMTPHTWGTSTNLEPQSICIKYSLTKCLDDVMSDQLLHCRIIISPLLLFLMIWLRFLMIWLLFFYVSSWLIYLI